MSWSMCFFFFFNDTATTEIYTLSLHDALPIYMVRLVANRLRDDEVGTWPGVLGVDRKSTRLNSSHSQISYAVFCLKKKKNDSEGFQQRVKVSHPPGPGARHVKSVPPRPAVWLA